MKTNILILILLAVSFVTCENTPSKYIANSGMIYGTYYSIKYESPNGEDFQQEINEELKRQSLIFSHYEREATITKVNNNIETRLEPEFITCFKRAMEISEITNGAFDITAGPLISAWGFGPEDKQKMIPEIVDTLKELIGYKKIKIENGKVIKENPKMTINMSAIAKGYTCDLMGEFLFKKGCENYPLLFFVRSCAVCKISWAERSVPSPTCPSIWASSSRRGSSDSGSTRVIVRFSWISFWTW